MSEAGVIDVFLLAELARVGVPASQCQAKIFGGSNMFSTRSRAGGIQIGQRNGEAALRLLRVHGIALVSESLYGAGHRQIIFELASGDVWSSQVRPSLPEIAAESDLGCSDDEDPS